MVADSLNISSGTFRAIHKISSVLASLYSKYIKFPDEDQLVKNEVGFYRLSKFPRIVGAIDCTHVRIERTGMYKSLISPTHLVTFSYNTVVKKPFPKVVKFL